MSKIEKELLKATGQKGPKNNENIQDYFERLVRAAQELPEEEWETLNKKTTDWANNGAIALNNDKDIKNFPDAEADEEEDKPKAKSKARDEDDEDKPKRKARDEDDEDKPKRKARADDDEDKPKRKARDDDEEDKPKRRARDDDEDDKPKRKARDEDEDDKPKRRARDDDEDDKPKRRSRDDDEDDKPKRRARDDDDDEPKSRRRRDDDEESDDMAKKAKGNGRVAAKDKSDKKPAKKESKGRGSGAQAAIKTLIIKDPGISLEKIAAQLEKKGLDATESSISSIRAGTLQTLRLVQEHGMPKGEI